MLRILFALLGISVCFCSSADNIEGSVSIEAVKKSQFSGVYNPTTRYGFESYAGSWLSPKSKFLEIEHGINGISNLEGASFSMILHGMTVMTRDYFDFQVLHLSSTTNHLPVQSDSLHKVLLSRMQETVKTLQAANASVLPENLQNPMKPPKIRGSRRMAEKTVVVIPYSGLAASQSVEHDTNLRKFTRSMRLLFVEATIYSIHRYFPNIIVAVSKQSDIAALKELNLPVWRYVDVSEGVKKDHDLPRESLKYLIKKFKASPSDDDYLAFQKFQYVYYSEADHILFMRSGVYLYNFMDRMNGTVSVAPHRMQTVAIPKAFPGLLNQWSEPRVKSLDFIKLVTEDARNPKGSCCDNGRFVFKNCGNWWYNCQDWGLLNYTQFVRFGENGFTMPFGTEHQGRCVYSPAKIMCPIPPTCNKRLPKSINDVCGEILNIEFGPGVNP